MESASRIWSSLNSFKERIFVVSRYFSGGIFEMFHCEGKPGHAVAVVGYDDVEKYWIIQNSWGIEWGEGGFIRLRKGYRYHTFGMCGVAEHVYYPIL